MVVKTLDMPICSGMKNCNILNPGVNNSFTIQQNFSYILLASSTTTSNVESRLKLQPKSEANDNLHNIYVKMASDIDWSVSTRIVFSDAIWNDRSQSHRQKLWLKYRNQIYQHCVLPHLPSICDTKTHLSFNQSKQIVRIGLYGSQSTTAFIDCHLCLLKSSKDRNDHDDDFEFISWPRIIQRDNAHFATVSNIKSLLQSTLAYRIRADDWLKVSIERHDYQTSLYPSIDLNTIFITSIKLSQKKPIQLPQKRCTFICGWGPYCLSDDSLLCDNKYNCLSGEDEEERFCQWKSKHKSKDKSLPTSSQNSRGNNYNNNNNVLFFIKNDVFIILLSVIFLLMVLLTLVLICCRSSLPQSTSHRFAHNSNGNTSTNTTNINNTITSNNTIVTTMTNNGADPIAVNDSNVFSRNNGKYLSFISTHHKHQPQPHMQHDFHSRHHLLTNQKNKLHNSSNQIGGKKFRKLVHKNRNCNKSYGNDTFENHLRFDTVSKTTLNNLSNGKQWSSIQLDSNPATQLTSDITELDRSKHHCYRSPNKIRSTEEWLNLFRYISQEARQRNLAGHLPPNVDSFSGDNTSTFEEEDNDNDDYDDDDDDDDEEDEESITNCSLTDTNRDDRGLDPDKPLV